MRVKYHLFLCPLKYISEDKLPYTKYTRPDQKLWGQTAKREIYIYRDKRLIIPFKWAPAAGTQAFHRSCSNGSTSQTQLSEPQTVAPYIVLNYFPFIKSFVFRDFFTFWERKQVTGHHV
jgi:hypothetical protein